jgi:hypothetical protein
MKKKNSGKGLQYYRQKGERLYGADVERNAVGRCGEAAIEGFAPARS